MAVEVDEYTCAECNLTFEKGWSDEEAQLEKEVLWGDLHPQESTTICDDCFNQLFPQVYPEIA